MTLDEQRQARAMAAAIREAQSRGWMAAGEVLPVEDEPQTGASVNVALLYRRYLADLRGVPVPPLLGADEYIAECKARRQAEARG